MITNIEDLIKRTQSLKDYVVVTRSLIKESTSRDAFEIAMLGYVVENLNKAILNLEELQRDEDNN